MRRLLRIFLSGVVSLGLMLAPVAGAQACARDGGQDAPPCHAPEPAKPAVHGCCADAAHCLCALAALPVFVTHIAPVARAAFDETVVSLRIDNHYTPPRPPPRA